MLFGYSLTKRFTWGCHLFLGAVEAFAPIGGWIAVTGTLNQATPIYLGLATVFWIAGLDIVYATQDADFDRKRKLHSIPAKFGLEKSFMLARLFHLITMILVIAAGVTYQAGLAYWIGSGVVAVLFIYQHSLVSPKKTEKLNFAFFGVNSWISFILMLTTLAETLLSEIKV
jgi:4-hydroxybenzoate polyprenyltransferase